MTGHVTAYLRAVLNLRAGRYEEDTFLDRPPRLESDVHLTHNGARWDIDRHDLPGDEFEPLSRGGGHAFGRFMLTSQPAPTPASTPPHSPPCSAYAWPTPTRPRRTDQRN